MPLPDFRVAVVDSAGVPLPDYRVVIVGEDGAPVVLDGTSIAAAGGALIPRYSKRPETIVVDCATTAPTSVVSGAVATIEAFDVIPPSGKTSGLKVATASAAADTYMEVRWTGLTETFVLSDQAILNVRVYFPEAYAGTVGLSLSSDNYATKFRHFTYTAAGHFPKGWSNLLFYPAEDGTTSPANTPSSLTWTVGGGMTTAETINAVGVRVGISSSSGGFVRIASIGRSTQKLAKPAVCVGFGAIENPTIFEMAFPLMRAAGIPGFSGGDGGYILNDPEIAARCAVMYDEGWDIIYQGYLDHTDYTADISTMSADLDANRALWEAMGWDRTLDIFTYPFSAANAATDAILVEKGIKFAKGANVPYQVNPDQYGAGDVIRAHAGLNIGGLTITQVRGRISQAKNYGTTLFLYCHGLTAGGTGTTPPVDTLLWYEDDFADLITDLAADRDAGLIDIHTPSSFINSRITGREIA